MNPPSIESLPNHLVGAILSLCSPKERFKLGTVCPQWQHVVDKYHGVVMITGAMGGVTVDHISEGNSRLCIPDRYQASISALEAIHGSSPIEMKVKPLNDSGDCKPSIPLPVTQEDLTSMLQIGPDLVRKLSFVGGLPIEVPLSLMKMCNNISALHFHLSSLVGVKSTLPLTIDMPTLKTLVVDSTGIWEFKEKQGKDDDSSMLMSLKAVLSKDSWFPAMKEIFKVVVALLDQNLFHHLNTLVLDIPYYPEQREGIMVTAIAKFLAKHADTLTSFCYHQGFPVILDDEDDAKSETAENDNESEVVEVQEEEEEEDHLSLSNLAILSTQMKEKKVNLMNIHIGLLTQQETDPLWKNLILFQERLKTLVFTGDQMPFPGFTLKHNAPTLTSVTIDVRDFIDLQALEKCSKLVTLSLQGKRDKEDEDESDAETWNESAEGENKEFLKESNIKNLQKLPKSLETLRIHGMNVDVEVLDQVIFSESFCPKLEGIELIDCGNNGKFGISMKAIGHILETKKFQWFRFDFSLNRRSIYAKKLQKIVRPLALSMRYNSVTSFKLRGFRNHLGEYVSEQRRIDKSPPPKELAACQSNWKEIGVRMMEPDIFAFPEVINPSGAYRYMFGDNNGMGLDEDTDAETETEESDEDEDAAYSTEEEESDNNEA